MNLTLHVWRQDGPDQKGRFEQYEARDISPDISFLEMLDHVNEQLTEEGREPIAFDSDCREGICGTCCLVIDGVPHGPRRGTTACQLQMRHFRDGQQITVEPWRARALPPVRDLVVDRSAMGRIMQAGGYISINTGSAPDANAVPVSNPDAETAFDAAACIGCGACVAACKNASAMLFVAAKVAQFAHLPQGRPESTRRVIAMVEHMDREGFGNCTNYGECEAVCPKTISTRFIADMNRQFTKAALTSREFAEQPEGHGAD